MTFLPRISALLIAAAGLSTTAMAQDFALTGGVGTMGGTVEGQFQVNDWFQLRAGANYLTFDEDIDVDDITYEGDLDFSGLGAFVDVHPFGGSFFVTGGAHAGGKSIDLAASSTVSVNWSRAMPLDMRPEALTVRMLAPRASICSSMARWAPAPRETIVITAATPMMMPSMVRSERSLWPRRLRHTSR